MYTQSSSPSLLELIGPGSRPSHSRKTRRKRKKDEEKEESEEGSLVTVRPPPSTKAVVVEMPDAEDNQALIAELQAEIQTLRRKKAEPMLRRMPGPKDLLKWVESCSKYYEVTVAHKGNYVGYVRDKLKYAIRNSVVNLAIRGGEHGTFHLSVTLYAKPREVTYEPTEEDLEEDPFARTEVETLEPYAVRMVYTSRREDDTHPMGLREDGLTAGRSMYLYMSGPVDQLQRLKTACKEEFNISVGCMFMLVMHGLSFIPYKSRTVFIASLPEQCFLRQLMDSEYACQCVNVE